jgi:hypothetical protein
VTIVLAQNFMSANTHMTERLLNLKGLNSQAVLLLIVILLVVKRGAIVN